MSQTLTGRSDDRRAPEKVGWIRRVLNKVLPEKPGEPVRDAIDPEQFALAMRFGELLRQSPYQDMPSTARARLRAPVEAALDDGDLVTAAREIGKFEAEMARLAPFFAAWQQAAPRLATAEQHLTALEGWKIREAPKLRAQVEGAKAKAAAGDYAGAIADFDSSAGKIQEAYAAATAPLVLTHKAECTTLPQARTRLGVGERVRVSVDRGPAAWTINGTPATATGKVIMLTLGADAGTVKVDVTVAGASASVTFTVVAPRRIRMSQIGADQHTPGTASAGFYGQPWVLPADVSFHGIQVREVNSTATASGAFAVWQGITHMPADQGASSWFTVDPATAGAGSKVNCSDNIFSGALNGPPPFAPGVLTFDCDWEYKVGSGSVKLLETLIHRQEIDASGKVTIEKGGNRVVKDYDGPVAPPSGPPTA
jgi:hypothetical protein